VCNDRIDEPSQQDGVAQIGCHLATFCQCPSHNRSGCGSEGEFEEPKREVVHTAQEEIGGTNKGGRGCVILTSKGKRQSQRKRNQEQHRRHPTSF
jgi:hypothetical protein